MDSISYLSQSIALFLSHHSGRLFEGEWIRYTLASDVGIGGFGGTHDFHELLEIPEKTKVKGFKG